MQNSVKKRKKKSSKVSISNFMVFLPPSLRILQHILHIKIAQALKALEGNKQHSEKCHAISGFAFGKPILCSRKKSLKNHYIEHHS